MKGGLRIRGGSNSGRPIPVVHGSVHDVESARAAAASAGATAAAAAPAGAAAAPAAAPAGAAAAAAPPAEPAAPPAASKVFNLYGFNIDDKNTLLSAIYVTAKAAGVLDTIRAALGIRNEINNKEEFCNCCKRWDIGVYSR